MVNKNKRLESLSDGALLAIAMIWGGCFPFVKMCLNAGLTSMQMLSSKFAIAAIITLAVFFKDLRTLKKDELKKGVMAGLILFAANYASTAGLALTSPANGAIITSAYIILIPFLWVFMGRAKINAAVIGCTVMCFVGIALMNYSDAQGIRLNAGDLLILAGALFFALQIVYVGRSVSQISVRKLVVMQMLVCAAASVAMSLLTDPSSLIRADYGACIFPLLYVGVLGTGLGYSAQIFAQRYTTPVKAGILMSMEGLFGAAFSVILGLTPITIYLAAGTALSVTAVILVEILTMNKQREDRP